MDPKLQRHFDACDNAVLPGGRLRLLIGSAQVGWVKPDIAAALGEYDAVRLEDGTVRVVEDMASDLPAIGEGLSARGLFPFRREEFDVRASEDGPVLARIDRGALPMLGVFALGVHLNGIVRRLDGVHVWMGLRAAHKQLEPGKLDNLVGGGVPAGLTVAETLIKEAAEEASLPEELVRRAVPVGRIAYDMEWEWGLRRDILYCFDLELPESFVPAPNDDEVERFDLHPIEAMLERVRETDDVKFNVNLVLIDLFRRLGLPIGR